jgi:hypothetical protein
MPLHESNELGTPPIAIIEGVEPLARKESSFDLSTAM